MLSKKAAKVEKSAQAKQKSAQPKPKQEQTKRSKAAKVEPKAAKVAKPDSVLAEAQQLAYDSLLEIAPAAQIGRHLGVKAEGQRLATHCFECLKPGYKGWQWISTLTRVPRSKHVTVCEIDLLPGEGALLSPEWVPWADRLQPSDISREDTLPFIENDPRLDPGYADTNVLDADERMVDELGLGRPRVINDHGRRLAAKRWYASEQGPAKDARGNRRGCRVQNNCANCGFLIKLSGSMRTMFGVCANQWSLDDGRVVSLDHTCGAHSETDEKVTPNQWEGTGIRLNDEALESFTLSEN